MSKYVPMLNKFSDMEAIFLFWSNISLWIPVRTKFIGPLISKCKGNVFTTQFYNFFLNVKGNWMPCAVFCKTSSGAWHSPRKELENFNVDPYFPDGVWCHIDRKTNTNYYCQNHLCLPGHDEDSIIQAPWFFNSFLPLIIHFDSFCFYFQPHHFIMPLILTLHF